VDKLQLFRWLLRVLRLLYELPLAQRSSLAKVFRKVNKDYTSQVCPNCDSHTGKKALDNRAHHCPECGYTTHRDVAAAQVIRNRGLSAEGRFVDIKEIACGGGLAGTGNGLVKSQRDRKKKGNRSIIRGKLLNNNPQMT
jgi:predicted RNA-binding Zn-ribbon protein involved in translation (DUF1610 family)